MPEHDEPSVPQTLPLILEFRAVGPEEFKDLFLGQPRVGALQEPPEALTSPICNLDAGPIS